MTSKMAHTCVRVRDLDASLAFYKEALGFEISRRRDFPDHQFTLVYLTLPGDDYELELTYNYDHGPYNIGDGYGHIAISVEDLEGLHAKHVEAGYEVTDLKGLPGTQPSYYFILDPDGYKIEVIRQK
ncbi:lactoylglutathione lyase [Streptococcus rupicaprae]|uniref:Aldoketomutase n=1 Tax=Streptococcus rupicaprae TaxID=759619 RepID=A0ABV2FGJ3_9STRE